jgi:hypothetical protein
MRKTAYLLAATLLTVTLCADRAMAAAPALRPEVVQLAEKLVSRLSESFGRSAVSIAIFPQQRPSAAAVVVPSPAPLTSARTPVPQPISPFQFRLPPPLA